MRTVTTVILRLLRNDAQPRLHGTLQTLDDPKLLAFKNEQELLTLLQQCLSHSPPASPARKQEGSAKQ
jgi:hypothetical protein